ncbi:response regulator [Hoyosella sp. G463]|uniref:Transcriptional regulatory protein KdpE n=1 Tax=Lolliginicoccus lacisalsi TaxID=2742202 RepID=A0A927J936_9ACTN|nr:response regulator [Lolliginicoccus lacisalsi]MBD8504956.1 response regulator [Lolliginicoccus lacisalsi]
MTDVLAVDDDPQILRALRVNLVARGYTVHTASTGAEALRAAAAHKPDVVILDLGLPDLDGTEVIHGLRGWTTMPIIVLSARVDSIDKVIALDAGADDYVTKPFGMDELLARLRAAIRRGAAAPATSSNEITVGSLAIDLAAKQVTRDGATVRLTPTEWGILELLVRNAGKLVTQKHILTTIWGPEYENESHYLRVYLAQLRRKLEDNPARPRILITEPGMGYRFIG